MSSEVSRKQSSRCFWVFSLAVVYIESRRVYFVHSTVPKKRLLTSLKLTEKLR